MILEELFQDRKHNGAGSTSLHMETLRRYASQCNHITEFGVHNGFSTIAFLAGRPKTLISYDIHREHADIDLIEKLAREQTNTEFIFRQQNTLKVQIQETDLLFVDSLHDYAQVWQELILHGNKARKFLILHDTVERATTDETPSNDVRQGILPALYEFLACNPHWLLHEHYTHQYGLTTFIRKGAM